ncbi:hypothetical protein AYO49_04595 [Verrucomicrobiaceae bacterium SCGC AG-212-N21]|nr:hypothetical protein AYO49_04595 [Verrucomicrobiaceae bacterium SCGC AG-212-N21]
MYWFCTHFDSNYLPQGLALYHSLARHVRDFTLIILCLDEEVERKLRGLHLDRLHLIPLSTLEQTDARLPKLRAELRRAEFCFNVKPCLCRYIFDTMADVDFLTYLDSDIAFFGSYEPLMREIGDRDAMVSPHRFAPHNRWRERWGLFNAGCVGFRRSTGGQTCLAWWHERCMEWCRDYIDGDRFADQLYLQTMAAKFPNVCQLQHPGANLAPWNLREDQLTWDGTQVLVQGQPLVFYHFSGVERLSTHVFDSGLGEYRLVPGPVSREHIFKPYLRELMAYSGPVSVKARAAERKAGRRSASALVLVNPLPNAGNATTPVEYVSELEDVLHLVEERSNQTVEARDAHIRALDAGGLWLREVIREGESLRKSDAARTSQLEKQLKTLGQENAWLRSHPVKALAQSLSGKKSADAEAAPAPSLQSSWPPKPEAVLARWSKSQDEPAERGNGSSPLVPAPGESCIFCHASPRALAIAARLASEGSHCTVMGCPGWMRSYSTDMLVLSIDSIVDKLRGEPGFLDSFTSILLDEADQERLQPLLEPKLGATHKVFLLDRSREVPDGLDFRSSLRPMNPHATGEDAHGA